VVPAVGKICERAHDLAVSVDPEGIGPRGARGIDGREGEREGGRCADQKSEERRDSRSETKECFLKIFCFYRCRGLPIPSENFARRCKKKCGDQGLLFFLCSAERKLHHQGENERLPNLADDLPYRRRTARACTSASRVHLDGQAIATSLLAYAGVGGVVVQVIARPVVNDDQLSAVVMHVIASAEDRDRCGDVVMDAVVVG
jgi:hypothetical protein